MQIDLSFLENEHESRAFMFSTGVIVLTIIAIIAFAVSGGSIIFYVFAVLAVALGLYMAYHISRSPREPLATARAAKKKTGKR